MSDNGTAETKENMPTDAMRDLLSSLKDLDGVRYANATRREGEHITTIFEVRGGPKLKLTELAEIRLLAVKFRTMWAISIQDDGAEVKEHVIDREKKDR